MARMGLLIYYEFCTGCHSCEVACQMEHHIPPGKFGIQIAQVGPWQIKGDKWQFCYVPIPTDLCTLCPGRVRRGKQPGCVQACQAAVMKFGAVEDLAKQMQENPGTRAVLFAPA